MSGAAGHTRPAKTIKALTGIATGRKGVVLDDRLWDECVRFHGHACPGLAMGYRAAELGMEALGMPVGRAADEEVVCVAENDACGVDAVQCMLSCTVGKGNLVMRPSGKMAFSFFDRRTGEGVRVLLKPRERTGDREAAIRFFLTAPGEDVAEVKAPLYGAPEKARSFDSVRCDVCGEPCREDKIRLSKGERQCSDCYDPYDR